MTRYYYLGRVERLVSLLGCSPSQAEVGIGSKSAVESIFRSNFLGAAAGRRLHNKVSEGLRSEGPLPGTRLGAAGTGDSIVDSGHLSAGTLKSRGNGKSCLLVEESPDKNTEETDGVTSTEGAEGPKDFAEKVKANDEANTASMKEAARNSSEEFKSDLA